MKRKKSRRFNSPGEITETRGFDASGHMTSSEARYLLDLARSTHTTDSDEAFVASTLADDDLAEELAKAAVMKMTSGNDALTDSLEANVDEEHGGPFVETSAQSQFAGGTDESNIAEATREPFPTANAGRNRFPP